MIANAGFMVHVLVTFSDCKESNAMKPSREKVRGYENRRLKVFNGRLYVRAEYLTFEKFDKNSIGL